MKKLRPSTPGEKQKGYYGNRPVKADQGTGGVQVVRKGMQRAIKTPCVECPFRRDSAPGYLGGYTPEMYMDATFSPVSLACHKSPGFHEGEIDKQRVCTGLAAFRANTGYIASVVAPRGQIGVVPVITHESTQFVGHDEETYFATPQEFIDHHGPGQK
jgi:hypothetical protein